VAFKPKNANQIDEILQQVARDIRNMYTIGYVPSDSAAAKRARKEALRRVAVDVRLPTGQKLAVRTRRAYLADDDAQNNDR
jgi:Ca-activated chloride channel family protein